MLTFKEFKDKSFTTKLPLRERFFRGLVFSVGQIVEDNQGKYQILDRGTNYVTVCNEHGDLSKKFIESIQSSLTEDIFEPTDTFGFKGFYPTHLSESAKSAFSDTIQQYTEGTITDAVAILKSIRAVDSLSENFSQEQMDIARSSLTRIGVLEAHSTYMDDLTKQIEESEKSKTNDRLKVASVIAATLGGDSSGSNPEMMVNNALRLSRKNDALSKTESTKIIHRMLELAQEVGINYDKNILSTGLNEISRSTVDSYLEKTQTIRPKTLSKVVKRFAGQKRAHDRVKSDEAKKVCEDKSTNESFHKGTPVKITHENGNEMYGLVDGIHGSVISVKHGNNRVTFNHDHKITKDDGKRATIARTFADVSKSIKSSEDLGKEASVDPRINNVPLASTLNPTSDTNRLQLAKN